MPRSRRRARAAGDAARRRARRARVVASTRAGCALAARARARARARPRGSGRRDQRGAGLRRVRWRRRAAASSLPRFGVGLGVEWLRPSRAQLAPDPGEPFRFTLGARDRPRHERRLRRRVAPLLATTARSTASTRSTSGCRRGGATTSRSARRCATSRHRRSAAPRCSAATSSRPCVRPLGDRSRSRSRSAAGSARPRSTSTAGRASRRGSRAASTCTPASRPASCTRSTTRRSACATIDGPRRPRDRSASSCRSARSASRRSAPGCATTRGDGHALGGSSCCARRRARAAVGARHGRSHRARRARRAAIGSRELTALVVAAARDRARPDGEGAGRHVRRRRAPAGPRSRSCATRSSRVQRAGKKVFAYMVVGHRPRLLRRDRRRQDLRRPRRRRAARRHGGHHDVLQGRLRQARRHAAVREDRRVQERARAVHRDRPERRPRRRCATSCSTACGTQLRRRQVAEARKLDQGRGQGDRRRRAVHRRRPRRRTQQARRRGRGARQGRAAGRRPSSAASTRSARRPTERPERWNAPGDRGHLRRRRHRRRQVAARCRSSASSSPAARRWSPRSPPRAPIREVGAIILRIDSPGGSALASELISREVFATRGVKPILCSMGDVAASGGYFIAAGCDLIFAEPMTITGSIGIFYGKFDLSGLLAKLGVTTETLQARQARRRRELLPPVHRARSAPCSCDKLRYMYGRFVGAVAEGRKHDEGRGRRVGRGHVWTGAQAKPIKLVDRFGGLGDALDEAKQRMGLGAEHAVQLYRAARRSADGPARHGSAACSAAPGAAAATDPTCRSCAICCAACLARCS